MVAMLPVGSQDKLTDPDRAYKSTKYTDAGDLLKHLSGFKTLNPHTRQSTYVGEMIIAGTKGVKKMAHTLIKERLR